eukprot:2008045-Amphidinium_carterae.1
MYLRDARVRIERTGCSGQRKRIINLDGDFQAVRKKENARLSATWKAPVTNRRCKLRSSFLSVTLLQNCALMFVRAKQQVLLERTQRHLNNTKQRKTRTGDWKVESLTDKHRFRGMTAHVMAPSNYDDVQGTDHERNF